ncbi:MAG: hypothetical protein COA49_03335 [Bacteroidetes bacterium]|nr:MAG: hypothetical protein COA49_03335 [Bacteroidota bacterium]
MKSSFFNKTVCQIIIISVSIISISGALINPKTSENGFMTTPDVFTTYSKQSYLENVYSGNVNLGALESTNQSDWVVFSDRDKNTLFLSPSKISKKSETLSYMERLFVLKAEGKMLLVASMKENYKRKEAPYTERGWISAENLILSNYAAVLNKKSSTRKAMILITVSNLDPSKMNEYEEELQQKYFYNSPSNSLINRNGKSANKFKIYYVLKEKGSMILLSSTDKLNGGQIQLKERVVGWIPKINVTNWDHRVCLEPNYGSRALSEYQNYELPIFNDDVKYILDFLELNDMTTSKDKIIKKIEVTKKRQNPYIMRMPILETYKDEFNTGEIKKVATIASLRSNKKKDEDIATIKQKIKKLQTSINNVDIFFVVDATQSMSAYFSSIANSIERVIKNQQTNGSGTKLRFGLAIYRDYADADGTFEIIPLTSDYDKVISAAKSTICKSNDNDRPEAQYQGLINGIDQAGFVTGHSNVLVLIGDAGNHYPDPKKFTKEMVIEKLIGGRISLIAFQVISGDYDSYFQFNYDTRSFLRETARNYVEEKQDVKLEKISDKNSYMVKYNEDSNSFKMFGRYTYASGNKPMDTDILEKNINEATNEYLLKTKKEIQLLESSTEGSNSNASEIFTTEFILYLKRMGFTDDQIKLLKSMGDISAKGYTSTKFFGKSEVSFYPVVFLSYNEKIQIDQTLSKLGRYGSGSAKKKEFKNAILQQTMQMLGAPEEVVIEMTMNEVWDIILGVPFKGNNKIAKMKLRDMDKLEDQVFYSFFKTFKIQADNFRKNAFTSSKFELAGQTFYWIPLNEFPGNE